MQQQSDAWFAARIGRATASRFSDVLATLKSGGEAAVRRDYRAQLVCERLTGKKEDGFTNRAMLVGVELEPDARMFYEAKTRNLVDEIGFVEIAGLKAGASPDGLIGESGCLEIKCPGAATHINYLRLPEGKAPAEYVAQIQGQLWATGRDWCDFVSYNPGFPAALQLSIRRVIRDDEYIAALAIAVAKFLGEVDAEEAELRAMMEKVAA